MTTTSLRPVSGPQTSAAPRAAASPSLSPVLSPAAVPSPSPARQPDRRRGFGDPLAAFRGFPRAIWVIFAGTVVNRVGFLVGPFLVFFLGSRGIAASQTPYVLGALGAGNLVGPAVGGWLADRHSRKLTMLAGLLGTAAAQGALFVAPNAATMAVAATVLSATASMVAPAASATLTDTVGAARRREAFALFAWAVNIGTAVAGMLGGYLAAHGYWMLFAIDAGTSLVYAAIVAVLLPAERAASRSSAGAAATASPDAGSGSGPDAGSGSGYGVVFRDRLTRRLLLLFSVQLFIYSLTESALPLAIRTDGLSPAVMGLAAAVNAGLVVVLQPFVSSLLARFPRTPVYLTGSALIAVGVALTGLAHSTGAYAATVAVWSVGEVVVSGIPAGLVANLAPASARGRYQGAFNGSWGVARFLALAVGTTAYTLLGPAFLWWGVVVLGGGSLAGIAALAPAIDRRSAEG